MQLIKLIAYEFKLNIIESKIHLCDKHKIKNMTYFPKIFYDKIDLYNVRPNLNYLRALFGSY